MSYSVFKLCCFVYIHAAQWKCCLFFFFYIAFFGCSCALSCWELRQPPTSWGPHTGCTRASGRPVSPFEWWRSGSCRRRNKPVSFLLTRSERPLTHLSSEHEGKCHRFYEESELLWMFECSEKCIEGSFFLPMATCADSTAWFTVSAQMWRLWTAVTPFTASRPSLTSL